MPHFSFRTLKRCEAILRCRSHSGPSAIKIPIRRNEVSEQEQADRNHGRTVAKKLPGSVHCCPFRIIRKVGLQDVLDPVRERELQLHFPFISRFRIADKDQRRATRIHQTEAVAVLRKASALASLASPRTFFNMTRTNQLAPSIRPRATSRKLPINGQGMGPGMDSTGWQNLEERQLLDARTRSCT